MLPGAAMGSAAHGDHPVPAERREQRVCPLLSQAAGGHPAGRSPIKRASFTSGFTL